LVAFFVRRLRNHAEAEDLTQEVFARLMALPSGEVAHLDAYIFQMAANLLRDRARRERVRDDYRRERIGDERLGVEPLDAERILAARDRLGQVAGALSDLPERTRTAFVLYRLEGMKKRDIADTFGISVSAVDKHLMKAMAHLMRRLGSAP
jgi:RNA polymerase sigma-70 factor (ECF subfamily)